jgi:hypothetical protein
MEDGIPAHQHAQAGQSRMPARNHSSAPRFNSAKPRELPIYFQELELLFVDNHVLHDQTKKEHARRYLPHEDFELWGSLQEFGATYTYQQFKIAVMKLYPGATEERKYARADVDRLIGERLRLGIQSAEDLSTYYRQFYVMTKYLVDLERMARHEQSRAFLTGFQPELANRVHQRLQLKNPDQHIDVPYALEQILEAAQYVIQGASLYAATTLPTTNPVASTQSPFSSIPVSTTSPHGSAPFPPDQPKQEDFYAFLNKFTQTIADTVATSMNAGRGPRSQAPSAPAQPSHVRATL